MAVNNLLARDDEGDEDLDELAKDTESSKSDVLRKSISLIKRWCNISSVI